MSKTRRQLLIKNARFFRSLKVNFGDVKCLNRLRGCTSLRALVFKPASALIIENNRSSFVFEEGCGVTPEEFACDDDDEDDDSTYEEGDEIVSNSSNNNREHDRGVSILNNNGEDVEYPCWACEYCLAPATNSRTEKTAFQIMDTAWSFMDRNPGLESLVFPEQALIEVLFEKRLRMFLSKCTSSTLSIVTNGSNYHGRDYFDDNVDYPLDHFSNCFNSNRGDLQEHRRRLAHISFRIQSAISPSET
ncbi:hypothetical protein BGZ83_001759, partial [Gryganskiella cystojenkinii]